VRLPQHPAAVYLRDLMADRFKTFAELAENKREGVHWRVTSHDRQSSTLVAAPHAGRAEPHTGKIAKAIAGAAHSIYLFETLSPSLHVTSHRFDEPRAAAQACRHSRVVTIHGCDNARSASADVFVGGLDIDLRDAIIAELRKAGFGVAVDRWTAGKAISNLCNRGTSSAGAQLEISRRLRNRLGSPEHASLLRKFARTVRAEIEGTRPNKRLKPTARRDAT
jgi:phage replication-related protein YjqB (UPF0714/DUF867 family)